MLSHDLDIPHSHVGPFGVLSEFQGKGVGSMLIEDRSIHAFYYSDRSKATALQALSADPPHYSPVPIEFF